MNINKKAIGKNVKLVKMLATVGVQTSVASTIAFFGATTLTVGNALLFPDAFPKVAELLNYSPIFRDPTITQGVGFSVVGGFFLLSAIVGGIEGIKQTLEKNKDANIKDVDISFGNMKSNFIKSRLESVNNKNDTSIVAKIKRGF